MKFDSLVLGMGCVPSPDLSPALLISRMHGDAFGIMLIKDGGLRGEVKVRLSSGTANRMGLSRGRNLIDPTTAYLLLERGCQGHCVFCPQAHGERGMVSRVDWPEFELEDVAEGLANSGFERICIQTSIYPRLEEDLAAVLPALPKKIPLSIAISPKTSLDPHTLALAGFDRIGVPIDGATKEVTMRSKGYTEEDWKKHFGYLFDLVEAAPEKAVTHIIVGLGESDRELALSMRSFKGLGIAVSIFALTPFPGSGLAAPSLERYRRVQLMAGLLLDNDLPLDILRFDEDGGVKGVKLSRDEIYKMMGDGEIFRTRGCPGCNRPFYNETPAGPWYNYPRKLDNEEALRELNIALEGLELD